MESLGHLMGGIALFTPHQCLKSSKTESATVSHDLWWIFSRSSHIAQNSRVSITSQQVMMRSCQVSILSTCLWDQNRLCSQWHLLLSKHIQDQTWLPTVTVPLDNNSVSLLSLMSTWVYRRLTVSIRLTICKFEFRPWIQLVFRKLQGRAQQNFKGMDD